MNEQKSGSILVVDDEASLRETFHFFLSFVTFCYLFLNAMVFKFKLFNFKHLLLYFRSIFVIFSTSI